MLFSSNCYHGFLCFQFRAVAQSCPTLCDPMTCSSPGLPLYHQLLKSTQTRVHWIGDAIQPFRAQDWKRSVFIPISKKGNAKECSYYRTIALISHASKVMLKILQATLQQYMNHELPDVQAGFRKDRGTRHQIVTSVGSSKKQESYRKHLFLLYWLCQSLWLCRSQ